MSTIRIKFTDFRSLFYPSRILKRLQSRFSIQVVDGEPDYVIFSVFGNEHLKFRDAIKIFYTAENLRPDFNTCDYAFAFDWMDFGDRYFRWPNYKLHEPFELLCERGCSKVIPESFAKRGFCNFVYTNRAAHPFRDQLFHALSAYRIVDSAGRHLNNVGFSPGEAYHAGWEDSKIQFLQDYKFTIACENSSTPGYTTEKIVDALAADTIPIYFGNPRIGEEFNSRRIINCHEFDRIEEIVRYVADLDRDKDRFYAMLQEPFFVNTPVSSNASKCPACDRFAEIFAQPKDSARRRSVHYWGWRYQEERRYQLMAEELLMELAECEQGHGRRFQDGSVSGRGDVLNRVLEWRHARDLCTPYDF